MHKYYLITCLLIQASTYTYSTDMPTQSYYGRTAPIIEYTYTGNTQQVLEELANGVNPNLRNRHGLPLLTIAAMGGRIKERVNGRLVEKYTLRTYETIKALIEHGADLSLGDSHLDQTAYERLKEFQTNRANQLTEEDNNNIDTVLSVLQAEDQQED